MNSRTYTLLIPGTQAPVEMAFENLKNAYADGSIPDKALVTLAHQDFWYPVAELMGDAPTKPLLFPCRTCRQMVKSRWIDRGNPVTCPKCQAALTVPNPEAARAARAEAQNKSRVKPQLWMGVALIVTGLGMSVLSYFEVFSAGGGSYGIFYGLILAGIILMVGGWSGFRGRRRPR